MLADVVQPKFGLHACFREAGGLESRALRGLFLWTDAAAELLLPRRTTLRVDLQAALLTTVSGQSVVMIPIPQDARSGHAVVVGGVLGIGNGLGDFSRVANEAAEGGFTVFVK